MKNKSLIKVINEEISSTFDFLGNEKQAEEQKIIDKLSDEDFQKQFICDSLLNKRDKIKKEELGTEFDSDWEKNGYIKLEYILRITYNYSQTEKPLSFDISFVGEHVSYRLDGRSSAGDYHTAPVDEEWFKDFGWNDINVDISSNNGTEVKFIAFENAPDRIKFLFIRDYIADFVGEWAMKGMRTPTNYDDVKKVPYC